MPEVPNQDAQSGKILLITGGFCALTGILMLVKRLELASFCFGARFLFGLPLTEMDGMKVAVITFGGLLTLVMSLVILAVGTNLFLKSQQRSPLNPPPPASRS